jgi:hypothetical protein
MAGSLDGGEAAGMLETEKAAEVAMTEQKQKKRNAISK